MTWVRIGDKDFNVDFVESMTEKEFIKVFEPGYKRIGKGRIDKMKQDYRELKKSFKKRDKKEKGD